MSEKIDKVRVKSGRLIRMHNTLRKKRANYFYYAVWVEDFDGKNERCILLTERELRVAEDRAKKNPEDLPKKNIITDLLD